MADSGSIISGLPVEVGLAKVCVVVPVFNEEASIGPFLEEVVPVLEAVTPQIDYRILFINDGSRDQTRAVISDKVGTNARIGVINLSRNFGKEAALFAGLCHAKGEAVIPLDVDLQDPPQIMVDMIARWRGGAKVVNARRVNRDSDSWIKRRTSELFYRTYNMLAEQSIPLDVGDFRLFDREVVDVICQLGERSRFNKGLFSWVGFDAEEVTFTRPERAVGRSAWSYWKLWKLALDGIFSSSTRPLRIWTYLGAVIGLLALAYLLYILIRTAMFGVDVPGYASTLILILGFGGLNIFALGIIGEYVGRIYAEVRQRPVYVVSSRYNVADFEA